MEFRVWCLEFHFMVMMKNQSKKEDREFYGGGVS